MLGNFIIQRFSVKKKQIIFFYSFFVNYVGKYHQYNFFFYYFFCLVFQFFTLINCYIFLIKNLKFYNFISNICGSRIFTVQNSFLKISTNLDAELKFFLLFFNQYTFKRVFLQKYFQFKDIKKTPLTSLAGLEFFFSKSNIFRNRNFIASNFYKDYFSLNYTILFLGNSTLVLDSFRKNFLRKEFLFFFFSILQIRTFFLKFSLFFF